MRNEKPTKVFSQDIRINCWIAINEITGAKAIMQSLWKDKIKNPDKKHLAFDMLMDLLRKSTTHQSHSPHLVSIYKEQLCEIIKIKNLLERT